MHLSTIVMINSMFVWKDICNQWVVEYRFIINTTARCIFSHLFSCIDHIFPFFRLFRECFLFRFFLSLGIWLIPHPRQKSGSTKEDVRNGNGYYSNKRKILAKRDKDKKIFSFSKNLLNRNAIKRKNMGIWGYFAAPNEPRKFFGV